MVAGGRWEAAQAQDVKSALALHSSEPSALRTTVNLTRPGGGDTLHSEINKAVGVSAATVEHGATTVLTWGAFGLASRYRHKIIRRFKTFWHKSGTPLSKKVPIRRIVSSWVRHTVRKNMLTNHRRSSRQRLLL
jgi:hypothetical protein